jgi:type I restriction and modification enzyme subunit R-like protein
MIKVSKRFLQRARGHLRKYQKVLTSAKARDVGESDTVVIITDFLAEVLGYDKYSEITTEFAIRSTFCDLAIKVDHQLRYLIEVKAIGTDLKENHLRQAVDYGAKQGAEWVILTNGACWRAYRIIFDQPIRHEDVFALDLLDPESKMGELLELLYLISREANAEIEAYWRHKEATSRFVVAQLLQGEPVLGTLRRELRRLSPGLRITDEELTTLLQNEVFKRDILEGDKAESASKLVRRASRRRERARDAADSAAIVPPKAVSTTAAAQRQ